MDEKTRQLLGCSALALLISAAPFGLHWTADDNVRFGIKQSIADDDDNEDDDDDGDDDDGDDDDGDDGDDRGGGKDRGGDNDSEDNSRFYDYLSTEEEADLIANGWK